MKMYKAEKKKRDGASPEVVMGICPWMISFLFLSSFWLSGSEFFSGIVPKA